MPGFAICLAFASLPAQAASASVRAPAAAPAVIVHLASSPTFGGYRVGRSHFPPAPQVSFVTTFTVPSVNCTAAEASAHDALLLGGGVANKFGIFDGIFQEVICVSAGSSASYTVDAQFDGDNSNLGSIGTSPGDLIEAEVTASISGGSATMTDLTNDMSLSASGSGIKPKAVDVGNDSGCSGTCLPEFSGLTFSSTTINGGELQSMTRTLYEQTSGGGGGGAGGGILTTAMSGNSFNLEYVP